MFMIYPLTSAFVGEYRIGLLFDSERIFLIPVLILGILLLVNHISKDKLSISNVVGSIIIYYLYNDFILFIHNNLAFSLIINHAMGLLFLIVIDNLKFGNNHKYEFNKIIIFIGFIISFVALYQFFIDKNFYAGISHDTRFLEQLYVSENVTRYLSIFTHIGAYGWYMMSIIFTFHLFKDYPQSDMKSKLISIVLIIPIALTFTRIYYLFALIAISFSIFYKHKRFRFIKILPFIISLIILGTILYTQYAQTTIMQDRLLSASYLKRFETVSVFFDKYVSSNILFGWGSRRVEQMSYDMYRRTGLLNGFLQVYVTSGLVGLFLFIRIFVQLHKKASYVFKKIRNPIFHSLIVAIVVLNFTSSADHLLVLPIYAILLLMKMTLQESKNTINPELRKNI